MTFSQTLDTYIPVFRENHRVILHILVAVSTTPPKPRAFNLLLEMQPIHNPHNGSLQLGHSHSPLGGERRMDMSHESLQMAKPGVQLSRQYLRIFVPSLGLEWD